MLGNKTKQRSSFNEIVIFTLILLLGVIYVLHIWKFETQGQVDHVLQIARSIEAVLPSDEIRKLSDDVEDLKKQKFPGLKEVLKKSVAANPRARFAYIYIKRGDKLYFVVDSEPENSPDYSPSGQEFTEADAVDKKPFETKKAQVTEPVTDRWGTWISAEVPMIDPATSEVYAVVGMDYNAKSWKVRTLFIVLQSVFFVIVIFFLVLLIRSGKRNNNRLKNEIKHRIQAENTLKESQSTLANLVSNLPGLIYQCALDHNYTMKYISDACQRITGYSAEEFVSKKSITFNGLILPEYQEPIWEKWQKVTQEGSIFEEVYQIRTASGEIKWLWERGKCVYDEQNNVRYLEGYIEDISSRKRTEEELRKLSLAIEQNPVSVVITDSKGNIEYINPRFSEMTGYDAAEVLGKNPRILKSGETPTELYVDLWQAITSGKIWSGEILNKKKNGDFYWASKSISPITDEYGRITNFVAIGEDISEKKKIERELIRAKEKAEESDRLKSAFLANISHEIRTPMNGIMGFSELLKEPELPPEIRAEYLDVIEKSGHRMLSIINDLIDISKIEAGQMSLRIRSTNVNKILHDLHLFFLPEVNDKNLDLDFHCDLCEEESTIETDPTKLNQVLTNLIKNAIKFTDNGSIKFGYKKEDGKLNFYVTDTGLGILPDQKELIFERFMQSTIHNLNRKFEGAGLGLAISKAYVGMLGGSIGIRSEVGTGSTFYFDLPYKQPVKP